MIENCVADDQCVMARDPDEACAMYYTIRNFVFFRRDSAKTARDIMTKLYNLENEDGADARVDIVMRTVEENVMSNIGEKKTT